MRSAPTLLVVVFLGLATALVFARLTSDPPGPVSFIDVGRRGDRITEIQFEVLPEGSNPTPYSATPTVPGDRPLSSSILSLIGEKLQAPRRTDDTTPDCMGVAVTLTLRSGRTLRYLSCDRPAAIQAIVDAPENVG